MSWTELIELLKDLGIFGFIIWGVQSIINKSASKKMENFRNEMEFKTRKLQSELDVERDKLKLQIEEIKYKNSKLHDKQGEVIETLYKNLVLLSRSIRRYTAFVKLVPINEEERNQEERQQLTDIEENFAKFSEYFELNRIYFTEEMCKSIEDLSSIYNEKMHDYIFPKDLIKRGMEPIEIKEEIKKSHEAANFFQREIPGRLKIIEDEFRKILNVV
jgi:hypothetical protein